MTSQRNQQTIKIHILPNISREVIEHNESNKAGTLVPDLFIFFKKALYEVKANDLLLSFNIF